MNLRQRPNSVSRLVPGCGQQADLGTYVRSRALMSLVEINQLLNPGTHPQNRCWPGQPTVLKLPAWRLDLPRGL